MKKYAIGAIAIIGLGFIVSSCATGKGGQKCPAYSKEIKKQSEESRV